MKKVLYLLLFPALFFSQSSMSGPNINAAVNDICQCGFPPSSRCINDLAKKYPEIDRSPNLQDEVMRRAQNKCGVDRGVTEASIRSMVGNENLDLSRLPDTAVGALKGINTVVSTTTDCSTASFKVAIPENWQCRKQNDNPVDVTLYTNRNTLNVTVGENQGRTSCSVIPVCTSRDYELSNNFDSKLYTNPMVGTYEYAGSYKKDSTYKLTITSNTQPTAAQLKEIQSILDSFKLH